MNFFIRIAFPAGQLVKLAGRAHIRELTRRSVTRLFCQSCEIDASFVDTNRRARLHTTSSDAVAGDALSEIADGRFGDASARNHFPAYV